VICGVLRCLGRPVVTADRPCFQLNHCTVFICCCLASTTVLTTFTAHTCTSTAVLYCSITGADILRNTESSRGVTCQKSSAECSVNYPLSLFRIPQPKNSAFPQITKLLFACIVQQMCNRCTAASGVPRQSHGRLHETNHV